MIGIASRPTEPLREEHLQLLPRIHALADAAGLVGEAPDVEVRSAIDDAYTFLAFELLPHALAEEAALYPAVEAAMAAPGATDTMRREHLEIQRLIEDLASARDGLSWSSSDRATDRELRRVLYGLVALVRSHFAKEEELYLEILDQRLDDAAATDLFERLEAAARQTKVAIGAPRPS
jgi:hemerythrin-like domain-containing protein